MEKPDVTMIRYYTTAAWLRGYISAMDPQTPVDQVVQNRLQDAADLLSAVWDNYAKEQGL